MLDLLTPSYLVLLPLICYYQVGGADNNRIKSCDLNPVSPSYQHQINFISPHLPMMDRTTINLLGELERLKYKDRVRKLVEIGRSSKEDLTSKDLISHLAEGSIYEKTLALKSCYGSQNIGTAMRLLSTPSTAIKHQGISRILLFATDIEVLAMLEVLPEYSQSWAIRRLRSCCLHRRRPVVIDLFLKSLSNIPDSSQLFKRLLPLGTNKMVEAHLSSVIDRFSKFEWSCLARFHPQIALHKLRDWAEGLEEGDERIVGACGATLRQFLSRTSSVDMALELLRILSFSRAYVPSTYFEEVAAKRPDGVLDLMIATNAHITYYMYRNEILAKLSVPKLLLLAEHFPSHLSVNDFRDLTISQRTALYEVIRIGWRSMDTSLAEEVVALLPEKSRILEARRIAYLPTFESSPSRKIPYVALLPWDEALILMKPFLESGDAAIRQQALYSQIRAAKYDDKCITDALQLVLKRKNEQDPVRIQMMKALSEIPASRLLEGERVNLAQIIRNALDATDISSSSLFSILGILSNSLSTNPRWGAQQMRLLFTHRSTFDSHSVIRLSGVVPVTKVMAVVVEELTDVVNNASEGRNLAKLLMLTDIFRMYVSYWPQLLDALERILTVAEGFQDSTVLDVLKTHRPITWHELMAGLNGSYVTWAEMKLQYINAYRQDMLSYYFEGMLFPEFEKPAFKTIVDGFGRWTQSQQESLAQIINDGLNNPEEDDWEKTNYIQQLSKLTFVGEKHLLTLARTSAPLVRDLALRSLGRLDGVESRAELIKALSDDRARISIYALRSLLHHILKAEALSILQEAPTKKITVAKEVTRMIGDLGTNAAFQHLTHLDKKDLHIDVRVSLFRALWNFLDLPQTWEIFTRAAQHANPVTAKALCIIPEDGMSPASRTRFYQLMIQLFYHPVAEVRIAALERCQKVPLKDPEGSLAPRILESVLSPLKEEVEVASRAMFRTYGKLQPAQIATLYRSLLSDRPRLQQVHGYYVSEPLWQWPQPTSAPLVLAVLKQDRLSVSMRLDLMFRVLQWKNMKSYFYEIIPELHVDAMSDAYSRIQGNEQRRTAVDNLEAEMELLHSNDEKARRLALAFLLADISSTKGWSDEQRERLKRYRDDESVMVAESAWKVKMPEEHTEEEKKVPIVKKNDWHAEPGDVW